MTAEPEAATIAVDGDRQPKSGIGIGTRGKRGEKKTPLPKPVPTTLRRRGAAIALGLTIVIVGALAFLNVLGRFSETVAVIQLSNDVARGAVITEDDLTTANIVTDPGLNTLSADRMDDVAGLRASTDLVSGTLLSETSLTSAMVPGVGERLVGVAVDPTQLPGEALLPGDVIYVVQTPAKGEPVFDDAPLVVEVTVLQTYSAGDSGKTTVDVLVDSDQAFELAGLVATQNIAIVIDEREL
jgi:hypothetical protein